MALYRPTRITAEQARTLYNLAAGNHVDVDSLASEGQRGPLVAEVDDLAYLVNEDGALVPHEAGEVAARPAAEEQGQPNRPRQAPSEADELRPRLPAQEQPRRHLQAVLPGARVVTWTATEAAESEHRERHTYLARLLCPDCGLVATREVFEGEADPCTGTLPDGSECESTEAVRA